MVKLVVQTLIESLLTSVLSTSSQLKVFLRSQLKTRVKRLNETAKQKIRTPVSLGFFMVEADLNVKTLFKDVI